MMQTGLLWYDDTPGRDLAEKVSQAARRYKQKFGVYPDVCYVHPSALSGDKKVSNADGVRVLSSQTALRNHLWIGCDDRKERDIQDPRI